MKIYKKNSRLLLAFVLSLALVFGLIPMMPADEAYAAEEDVALTVYFVKGDDKIKSAYKTVTYTAAELTASASALYDPTDAEKYLTWEQNMYKVLQSASAVPMLKLLGMEDGLLSNWLVDIGSLATDGKALKAGSKTFNYQDFKNGKFYGETTSAEGITSDDDPTNTPVLSLSTGVSEITTTAGGTSVSSFDQNNGMRFLIGLPNNKDSATDHDYIKTNNDISRYVSNVDAIIVREPVELTTLKVSSVVTTEDSESTFVKTLSKAKLEGLTHNDQLAFLYGGGTWSISITNKYIPLNELLAASGIVMNSGDELKYIAGDGFSAKQTYEDIAANKYYYPDATDNGSSLAGKEEVGAVLALNYVSASVNGTASETVRNMNYNNENITARFMNGLSEDNYVNKTNAGGNRFVSGIVEMKVTKDKADYMKDAEITLDKTTYTATGKQIKPSVTVRSDGATLIKDAHYTLEYGTNKVGKGTVTIKSKNGISGNVSKTFKINPRSTSIKSIKVGSKKATVKWNKAKDAVTGYQIAYKKKGAKKYKVITVKKQKTVSKVVKKLAKNKKYQFKIRTYKTDGKAKYYSAYSKVKTSKKIKK